ncbi:MAG: phosphate acyltransferase PlsX [Alphaproteobacteria bacterium]|nr:phosphate acyltransferase PlsX [Alphaproteobacteria bacterium]
MTRALTVSIDAMGGDAGPAVVVSALLKTIQRHTGVNFILHGDEAELKRLVARQPKLQTRVSVRHAPGRVTMEDKPSHVLRRGKDTSMWHTINCVKEGDADVAVSAGNTGALMAVSMFGLGIIEGISRPAIAVIWPTLKGQTIVLDVGANVAATDEMLVDFAVMGEAFAHVIFGLERPTVGILNVGAEEQKGNDGVRGAAQILRNSNLPMAFHGFVEGDDIAKGTVDVVVTDGFTGNIALKTAEGTARLMGAYLRAALKRSFLSKLGAVIAAGALQALRRKLDPRAQNGGIFLGLNGVVVKSHGGADAVGFASALDMAIDMARADINARITTDRSRITAESAGARTGEL